MHSVRLAPSMMCMDLFQAAETLAVFEVQKVDYLHMDIMDGHFVSNLMMGTAIAAEFRAHTVLPFDYHFMVTNPLEMMPWFDIRPGDMVSVHIESAVHLQRALAWIKGKGAAPAVALNPATPIGWLEDVLPDLEYVLLMAVNPGYAGQSILPQIFSKASRLRQWLDSRQYQNIRIEVDGNVTLDNAQKLRKAGADTFVSGSSGIFSKEASLPHNIESFRKTII
jgi:ribulose-phosphate 3-epimerase